MIDDIDNLHVAALLKPAGEYISNLQALVEFHKRQSELYKEQLSEVSDKFERYKKEANEIIGTQENEITSLKKLIKYKKNQDKLIVAMSKSDEFLDLAKRAGHLQELCSIRELNEYRDDIISRREIIPGIFKAYIKHVLSSENEEFVKSLNNLKVLLYYCYYKFAVAESRDRNMLSEYDETLLRVKGEYCGSLMQKIIAFPSNVHFYEESFKNKSFFNSMQADKDIILYAAQLFLISGSDSPWSKIADKYLNDLIPKINMPELENMFDKIPAQRENLAVLYNFVSDKYEQPKSYLGFSHLNARYGLHSDLNITPNINSGRGKKVSFAIG